MQEIYLPTRDLTGMAKQRAQQMIDDRSGGRGRSLRSRSRSRRALARGLHRIADALDG